MSDVLTGNRANITTPLVATVTALSSGSGGTIRVTTSAPHLYGSADLVLVQAGSTDGIFSINVIDSTHYDLIGSTFVAGGSGSSLDQSLTPQILFPTDGDALSAQLSGLLSGFQGLCDRTQFLQAEIVNAGSVLNSPVLTGFSETVNFYQGTESLAGPVTIYQGAGYDATSKKWLIGGPTLAGGSGALAISTGRNEPVGWTALISASSGLSNTITPQSLCRGIEPGTSPSSKYVYMGAITASGGAVVIRADTNLNSWSTSTPAGTVTDATTITMASTVNSTIIAAIGAGTTDSNVYFSINSGASWVPQSAASIVFSVGVWWLAQSTPGGGIVMAVPAVSTSIITTLSTATGNVWVVGSVNVTSGHNETPTGLVFGQDEHGIGCFILFTRTQDNRCWSYRSFDGVNWKNFSNDLQPGIIPVDITNIGSIIVAPVDEGPPSRVICSVNGGINWVETRSSLFVVGGFGMASSPNGVMYTTGGRFTPSFSYGSPGGIGSQ